MLASIGRFVLVLADSGPSTGAWLVLASIVTLSGTVVGLVATYKISKRQTSVEEGKANLSQVEAVNKALSNEIARLRKDREEDRVNYESRIKTQDEKLKAQDERIWTLQLDLRKTRQELGESLEREVEYQEAIKRLEKKTDGIADT